MDAGPRLALLLGMMIASALHSLGTTYYVSSRYGRDANAGLTSTAPWKTIANVNSYALKADDLVLFRRGDSWRETLRPRSSGTQGHPIIFGAYGSGPSPTLIGSERPGQDVNIDNNEQSYIVYRDLELRGGRQGVRLYAWRHIQVRGITLENSVISTGPREPHGTMSAGVYASVDAGSVEQVIIRHNHFYPYPAGLEHWGVYFVKGISDFRIEDNVFGPAGEDAICVWHSADGVIARNRGGGNGENTIDVKDSHEVVISENIVENDKEYNIVVHSVDPGVATHDIVVKRNTCRRGGQGGEFAAGIALLFVEKTTVSDNAVEDPIRAGIYVKDRARYSGNKVSGNRVIRTAPIVNGRGVLLEGAPGTEVLNNRDVTPSATKP
jgi:hypothetical protein